MDGLDHQECEGGTAYYKYSKDDEYGASSLTCRAGVAECHVDKEDVPLPAADGAACSKDKDCESRNCVNNVCEAAAAEWKLIKLARGNAMFVDGARLPFVRAPLLFERAPLLCQRAPLRFERVPLLFERTALLFSLIYS